MPPIVTTRRPPSAANTISVWPVPPVRTSEAAAFTRSTNAAPAAAGSLAYSTAWAATTAARETLSASLGTVMWKENA